MATTLKQSRKARFQKGSGVYTCRMCSHNTRDSGGDGAGVRLCDICYELAGEDNSISDTGELYDARSTREMLALLDTRRGNGTAKRLFPRVFETAFPETQEAAPVQQAGTIDATPTWAAILPILILGIESGNETGRATAKAELLRMAEAADKFNASIKV